MTRVTNAQVTDFFRRFNQQQFPHQRLGQAFLNFFKIDCTHLGDRQCARKACQKSPAPFFNSSTEDYYCRPCAWRINKENNQELCKEEREYCLFQERNDGKAAKTIWESFVDPES